MPHIDVDIGRGRFVRSQSFSHHHRHHHHHRPRCPEDCARVTVEQWNGLCRKEGEFRAINKTLQAENQTLKAELEAALHDNRRLAEQDRLLRCENDDLRRALSADGDSVEAFRRRITVLTAELQRRDDELRRSGRDKTYLETRVRTLSETLGLKHDENSKLRREIREGKRRWDDLDAAYKRLGIKLENKLVLMEDLRHQLRHAYEPKHHHRYYAYG
ncbi:hypothetical protein F5Y15DRAFT_149053 [Xylariaceae sp. FL0016]|nr:hypothetical protein F5Y15DRAFT_149053 [Xylariaceae sp. FL0016]